MTYVITEEVLSVSILLNECLVRVIGTSPRLSVTRVLVIVPVLPIIVELVRVLAVFVCAHIRAEVMYEVGSAYVSAIETTNATMRYFLLPCLSG